MSQSFLTRTRLSGQLSLSYSESTKHKVNYLALYFLLPLTRENAARAATLSHLITCASERYPSMQTLRRAKEELYGADISASVRSIGETLVFALSATFLKDAYALTGESVLVGVLRMLEEFLRRPYLEQSLLSSEHVRREIKNAADDARALFNDKFAYARRRHTELMYQGEPFACDPAGEVALIEAQTPATLTDFLSFLLHSARVEAVFVGQGEQALLCETLSACFNGLLTRPVPLPETRVGTPPSEVREITEYMDVAQANLCIGYRTPVTRTHSDYFAFTLGNAIFGSGTTCKLFMNVREKLSLCYRTASVFEAQKGFLQVFAGIEDKNRARATEEILRQLEATQKGDFTDAEYDCAKNTLQNALRTYAVSPDILSVWVLPRLICGVDADPYLEIRALEAVTPQDAARAMQSLTADTVYCLQKEVAQ